jgi:starch synthase
VHNLAFQGTFGLEVLGELGLPADFYQTHGLEFHGQVSFMKAGLHYADHITTVSPTYAREIQGEEQGCGLDGVLRARAGELSGILNAVDDSVWNPAIDGLIPARYDGRKLTGKNLCRMALQNAFGLGPQTDRPLFGVVSRLTEQKGFNLILDGLPELLERGGQLVMLGTGDAALVAALVHAARTHPGAIAVKVGYDEELAHRIVAGVDVMMVPSRFEPCGLTQLYGLKYGSLPLVRKVGGLADTVVDSSLENLDDGLATGFVFERFAVDDYVAALRRAFALFKRKVEWQEVQRRAMAQAFDWDAAAAQYIVQYERVMA